MKLVKFNIFFEKMLYVAAFVCFIGGLIIGSISKSTTPVSIIFVLTAIHIILKKSKIEIPEGLKTSIYFFIVVCMFLADEFSFYSIIPYLDKVEHLSSGVILTLLGYTMFNHINRNETNISCNKLTAILFSAFFAIAMAGCWEIFEFTVDHLFGLNTQLNSLWDTMTDIICGTTGAIFTSIYLYNMINVKVIELKADNNENVINI